MESVLHNTAQAWQQKIFAGPKWIASLFAPQSSVPTEPWQLVMKRRREQQNTVTPWLTVPAGTATLADLKERVSFRGALIESLLGQAEEASSVVVSLVRATAQPSEYRVCPDKFCCQVEKQGLFALSVPVILSLLGELYFSPKLLRVGEEVLFPTTAVGESGRRVIVRIARNVRGEICADAHEHHRYSNRYAWAFVQF